MRELANLAVYLLHPLSEYVNGQTIAIDGGGWNAGGGGFQSLRNWTDEQWEDARAARSAAPTKRTAPSAPSDRRAAMRRLNAQRG